jgi:ketosteroid isomerase-like protein
LPLAEFLFSLNGVKPFLFVLLPLLLTTAANRDVKKTDGKSGELFEAVARMDRHLFDAFNAHNVDRLMALAAKDAEFYQDNDGMKNYQQTFDEFKVVFASNADIRRELVDGTLEVYPIKDYGALEVGQHRVCQTENGKEHCAVFKFTMLWQKTDDSWKLSRVISYGH